jgi:glutaconate CoA-transferase subunit A
VLGYYNIDFFMYALFTMVNGTADSLKAWMDEWVYGCANRAAYIDRYIEKFGSNILDGIKAKAFYSAPANYGSAFTSRWDREGRERNMGLTMKELEKTLKERGMLYE